MFEQTVETSATPHITVTECRGNLVVRGSEERRITLHVQGRADDVALEREGETFTLVARASCFLTCPPATTLTVGAARRNLKVEGLEGPVTASTVHGNATLRGVGPTALEQVFGNLNARHVMGDLSVQTTKGNARVRQVEGSLSLDQVGGNLVTEGLQGGLTAEKVRGNARLRPPFSTGATYQLSANGNLTVRLPADTSLRLDLRANGGIRSHIPGLVLEGTEREAQGVLGTGEASLEAQIAGRISLRSLRLSGEPEEGTAEGLPLDFLDDLEGLGEQIETSIASAMAEVEARLEESLGRIDDQGLRRQVEREAERAMRKAEHVAGQARRKAELEAERARLRAERAERRWRRASGQRERPRRGSATDEERMRVLRLVEEGKVTPEQAADLLAALEGR